MKNKYKNMIVGLLVYVVLEAGFLAYDYSKYKVLNTDRLSMFVVYIVVFVLVSILLIKFGKK